MYQQTNDKTDEPLNEGLEEYAPDRALMLPYWDLIDAIMGGVTTIRLAGKKYLPQFPDETKKDYEYRLQYARFTNIFRDIVEGLSAKPFEKEISFNDEPKKYFKDFSEDVDGRGNNLTQFASVTFFNGIANADDWIMIDHPVVDPSKVKTINDKKKSGVKPYWVHVLGRNILEVQTDVVNSKEVLTYVRIFEPGEPNQVRIFERTVAADNNGAKIDSVQWSLFEQIEEKTSGKKSQWRLINNGTLGVDVIPIVPFATARRNGKGFAYYPAMNDAADLQLELYKDESALNFAKNMTAYPMLSANGVTPEKDANGVPKSVPVGPMKILYAPRSGDGQAGNWEFIEITAESLKFLKDDIKETKNDLRELGRQPLTSQSGNLTVIQTAVASGKARSAVGAWALALKDTLENAMLITAKWEKMTDDDAPSVTVYTEFDNMINYGEDLTHLREMRKNGDISARRLTDESKRRGILSDDFDFDDDQKEILDEQSGEEFNDFGDPSQMNQDVSNGDNPENQQLQNTDVEQRNGRMPERTNENEM